MMLYLFLSQYGIKIFSCNQFKCEIKYLLRDKKIKNIFKYVIQKKKKHNKYRN